MNNTDINRLFADDAVAQKNINEVGYNITNKPWMFFDKDALRVQPDTVYRLDSRNFRYYYRFLDSFKTSVAFYVSVTSSIASNKILPTSPYLTEWYQGFKSMDEAHKEMSRLADYGKFAHIVYADFMINKELEFDSLPYLAKNYKEINRLEYDNSNWVKHIERDILALHNWANEHEIKPMAIELMLTSREGFATAVDLVCEMTIGSGQNGKVLKNDYRDGKTQRVTAVIDWKSNFSLTKHKSFYQSNEMQLEASKRLVEENFPMFDIDRTFNVSFEGGISTAKAVMKDQTDRVNQPILIGKSSVTEFDLYWELYKAKYPLYRTPPRIQRPAGKASIGDVDSCNIESISPEELVIAKHREKEVAV